MALALSTWLVKYKGLNSLYLKHYLNTFLLKNLHLCVIYIIYIYI